MIVISLEMSDEPIFLHPMVFHRQNLANRIYKELNFLYLIVYMMQESGGFVV